MADSKVRLVGESVPLKTDETGGVHTLVVKVDELPAGGLGGTQYEDGDAKGDSVGTLAMASDGTLIQAVASDSDGHLQVDVLSGAAGGTQYADGAARGTATGTVALVDDGVNLQSMAGDANGHVQVDIVSGAGGTQYADGAARGTPTGTLMMVDDGVNIQSVAGDANGHVQVDVQTAPAVRALTASDVVTVTGSASQTADVKVTLDSEKVTIAAIDAGDTNIGNVDIASIATGTNNIGDVDVASHPSDTFAADGQAYGKGVLIQGDDGTNRRAILVDEAGNPQVDVVSMPSTTVTATHLDTRHLNATDDAVVVSATHLDTRHLNVTDDAVVVSATHLDTRHLNATDDTLVLAAGVAAIGTVTMVKPVGFAPGIYNAIVAETDRQLVAAPGANKALVITDIIISNDPASADGTILFEDDTTGAKTAKTGTLWVLAGTGVPLLNLGSPIICATNKNFGFTSTLMTTHSVTVLGYVKDV